MASSTDPAPSSLHLQLDGIEMSDGLRNGPGGGSELIDMITRLYSRPFEPGSVTVQLKGRQSDLDAFLALTTAFDPMELGYRSIEWKIVEVLPEDIAITYPDDDWWCSPCDVYWITDHDYQNQFDNILTILS
jgi:hypothetical protein